MTDPERPFRGRTGFLEQVAEPIDVSEIGLPRGELSAIERTAESPAGALDRAAAR